MLELHSSARFAWQQKQVGEGLERPRPRGLGRVLLWVHNLIYWFFLVPFVTPMTYETGFAIYSAILFLRFAANTWINLRDLGWEAYYRYPLRIP